MENSSRTASSARNVVLGLLNKVITMLLVFITRAVFVRILAVDYLGINGLFTNVIMMLSMADLGIGTAMTYSLYKPFAEDNKPKIVALLTFYKKMYNYIALFVGIIGLAMLPFLKYIVNVQAEIPYLNVYYLVFLANLVISYLYIYKYTIILADQKLYLISKLEIWLNIFKLMLQSIVLWLTNSYFLFIIVNVFYSVGYNYFISKKADRLYPYIKEKGILEQSEKKDLIENLKSVVLYKIANVSFNGTDNILISILVSTAAVGMYANYLTITNNISAICYIFFNSLTASIGNLIAKESSEKRYKIYRIMQMLSFWVSATSIVCLYFLTDDFLYVWVGNNYIFDRFTLAAILVNFYLSLVLQPVIIFREAAGIYIKTKYAMLISAILNIILSLIFGHFYGVAGVIFATFASGVSTYFWYEQIVLCKYFFNISAKKYFVDHIINATLTVGCIYLISRFFDTSESDNVYFWVFKAVVCIIIVTAVFFIRYFKTEEFKDFKGRVYRALFNIKERFNQNVT